MSKPRVVIFDIENNNLAADYGWLICMGWKVVGEKGVHIETLRDYPALFRRDATNDKEIAKACARVIGKADMLVGHYSTRHDYPYINTRLAFHGLPPLPMVAHYDTWWNARKSFKLHSNRLASLAEFLKVKHHKTPISQEHWRRSASGHVPSLKYIEDHCRADILVTEECYLRLRPFSIAHPNVNLMDNLADLGDCPQCGSRRVQRRGMGHNRTTSYWRYFCLECHGWGRGKPIQGQSVSGEKLR